MITELKCPSCNQLLNFDRPVLFCGFCRCASTVANDGVELPTTSVEDFKLPVAMLSTEIKAAHERLTTLVRDEEWDWAHGGREAEL